MLRHPDYTRTRIQQLVQRLGDKIYTDRRPLSELLVAGPVERISYEQAQQLKSFRPAVMNEELQPLWATFWFRGRGVVPEAWKGSRVDLLWDTQSEATLWVNGRIIQGLNMTSGDRPDAILYDHCTGNEEVSIQVEMACNTKFGVGLEATFNGSLKRSPFLLRRCEIAQFDPQAWDLYWDAYVFSKLELELDREKIEPSWAGLLLAELNRFCNVCNPDDRQTWAGARQILQALKKNHNASRTMELTAIGHAHIDTAWLWPLAETYRKCERTFSSATAYMRDYPEYRFSCSQAFQYATVKQRNPDLYARIKQCVTTGQFVPVGGTWIEPDCNLPSGEALCRQFLFGQRFFEKEFGQRCLEFWNPDVFGYNGQLPQIMRLAGIKRFLTQKLAWNRFNKPRHHTFIWRGIDGSEVLTHFPPADTYNAFTPYDNRNEIAWLRVNLNNFRDHDRSQEAIFLYGFGDGGGGPTKSMLEILRRVGDLQGLPRTVQRSSNEFFERLERDITDRPVIIGELYLEYHRGTYTSQAMVKRNNRRAEQLLHDLEFCAVASGGPADSRESINELWKTLLLNQFHDILPGSSIALVYEDSARQYIEFFERGEKLLQQSTGNGSTPINTIGFPRAEVVEKSGKLGFVEAPPYGDGRFAETTDSVRFEQTADRLKLENKHLAAEFTLGGRLISLIHKDSGCETCAGEGNAFELYDDWPTDCDAWDADPFHLETGKVCPPAGSWKLLTHEPLRVALRFDYTIGNASRLTQIVQLDAAARRLVFQNEVEWQETHKFLKVAFPVNAHAMNATYEMQFGHVERPTHYNTPYDLARYEVPMHRWFDLSEHGFGVAILNDCKYGGSTFGNVMRLSLLRAPTSPDPKCDRGHHRFDYAVMPHTGNWQDAGVVAEGYRFNNPIRFGQASPNKGSFAVVDDPNLVLDTIKQAEDSTAIVLRLYECHGGRGTAHIQVARSFTKAVLCNVLEDDGEAVEFSGNQLHVEYQPHQIISIKLS